MEEMPALPTNAQRFTDTATSLRKRAWKVALIAAVALSAMAAIVPAADAGASKSRQEARMLGEWDGFGQVVAAHHSATDRRGAIISRLWVIYRDCSNTSCPFYFSHVIGPSVPNKMGHLVATTFMWHSGSWRAKLVQPGVACLNPTPGAPNASGTETSWWIVRLKTPSELSAIETTRTAGPGCVTATSRIRWVAGFSGYFAVGNPGPTKH
jgi:hypothetical protein